MEMFQLLDIVDNHKNQNFYLFGKTFAGASVCVEVEGFRNYILIRKPRGQSRNFFLNAVHRAFIEVKMKTVRRVKSMRLIKYMKMQKWPESYKFKILQDYIKSGSASVYSISRKAVVHLQNEDDVKDYFVKRELEKLEDGVNAWVHIAEVSGRDICDVSSLSIDEDTCDVFYKISLERKYDQYALKAALRTPSFYNQFYASEPTLYNCNISRHQRWMLDYDIKPCFWIKIDVFREMSKSSQELLSSKVTVRGSVKYNEVHCVEDDRVCPLRMLCLDIETEPLENNKKERQIDASIRPDVTFRGIGEDNILQISLVWSDTNDTTMSQILLYVDESHDSCDRVSMSQVYDEVDFKPSSARLMPCKDERSLLVELRSLILYELDPDIITGYNVAAFDMHAIWRRCEYHNVKTTWSRLKDYECPMKITKTTSRAHGASENYKFTIGGRTLMDLYELVKKEHNLISYKLDVVAEKFLGTKKLDCKYEDIPKLQETFEGRLKMGAYCLKDSWIVMRLLEKLCKLSNVIEMSRVTGIAMREVLNRGQMIRSLCCIYRYAKRHVPPYFLPEVQNKAKFRTTRRNTMTAEGGLKVLERTVEVESVGYKGAVVFPPTPGYYKDPVCCLDFASLYPSIMRYRNMCYSTLVSRRVITELNLVEDVDYHRIADVDIVGNGDLKIHESEDDTCFLTHKKRPGILPEILATLLMARKRAKKDMKNATDQNMYKVCNGRQLALKLVCNSMYGFTGTSYGFLPCLAIASAVTSTGRFLALSTKATVEKNFKGCVCVYGDTDRSVIVLVRSLL
jgi:DNA polymerase delta subunit 1